jgi:hypothetical protein
MKIWATSSIVLLLGGGAVAAYLIYKKKAVPAEAAVPGEIVVPEEELPMSFEEDGAVVIDSVLYTDGGAVVDSSMVRDEGSMFRDDPAAGKSSYDGGGRWGSGMKKPSASIPGKGKTAFQRGVDPLTSALKGVGKSKPALKSRQCDPRTEDCRPGVSRDIRRDGLLGERGVSRDIGRGSMLDDRDIQRGSQSQSGGRK